MNETKIVSIDVLIDRIKKRGYIDCNEDGYYDEYEYDNILYYLEKYKNLQSKIYKANEILNRPQFEYDNIPCNYEEDIKELRDVLKEAE